MENKIITVVENKELIEAIKENVFQWNGIEKEDIENIEITEIFNNVYEVEVENYNYIVSNDYDALEQLAIERNIEIIAECGLTQNLIDEAYIKGWIDEYWFEDFWREHHEFIAYEESIEYVANTEEMEAIEAGELDEEEVRENYLETLNSNIGNPIDEYKFQFGDEEFQRVLLSENLIDIDKVAEWCVDMDGVAHTLATWDGEETETNGYYFYQC